MWDHCRAQVWGECDPLALSPQKTPLHHFRDPFSAKKKKNNPLIEHHPPKKELKFGAFPTPSFYLDLDFNPSQLKKEVNKGKIKSYLLGLITIIKLAG